MEHTSIAVGWTLDVNVENIIGRKKGQKFAK
jgi:hypothetical protein